MKVTGDWLTCAATQSVFDAYEDAGFSLFAVGGCIRNALFKEPVSDIDMSSNARPAQATEFLQKAGFKVIPTGFDHGTITVLSGGVPFEITTFRKDVETDGRHAVVAFSDTMEEDARRRDFTMNALYADRDGTVFDPVNGLPDVAARSVRFIGNGADRIREDFLRTLRFFRFHARYGDPEQGFSPDALHAISSNLDGLSLLSRERVGSEMLKLLAVGDPSPAVMTMQQTGVLNAILPGCDAKALPLTVHLEEPLDLGPDPIRRLASLADIDQAKTLRLSKAQLRQLSEIRNAATGPASASELGFRMGEALACSALVLRSAFFETPMDPKSRDDVKLGANAVFPIKANDLPESIAGKAIGEKLRELEDIWIASGFTLTKSQLLG